MKTNAMWLGINMRKHLGGLVAGLLVASAAAVNAQYPSVDTFNPWASGTVRAMAVRPDGLILLGGDFQWLGYITYHYRYGIGMAYADGTIDPVFNPGPDDYISAILMQRDGRSVIGGAFRKCGGSSRVLMARINPDGRLDGSFDAQLTPAAVGAPMINALALQPDDKILVAGSFIICGGLPRPGLARINANGTVDASFNSTLGSNGTINALAVQTDGKILVGGKFSVFNGAAWCTNLARLDSSGNLDSTFTAAAYRWPWPWADESVNCLLVQPDGKILVGGGFDVINNAVTDTNRPNACIARLSTNGVLDTNFKASLTPSTWFPAYPPAPPYTPYVLSMVLQTDGKILIGGNMDAPSGGFQQTRIMRLNGTTGAVDSSFYPMPNGGGAAGLGIQPDGKTVVGGWFTTLSGVSRNYIGRLNNTDPPTQNLSYNSTSITWLRGGASPEVYATTMEYSTNGLDWVSAAGGRISGGWKTIGQSIPSNPCIRVRGYLSGGYYNGSSWYVEAGAGKPFIDIEPANQTNNAGTTTAFNVAAGGGATLVYQWRKNNVNLTDGANVLGSTNAILTLTNVLNADAANYSVVITNASGSVTSAVVRLVVTDPIIVTQPKSAVTNLNQTAAFSVSARGTLPLNYQWRRNGTNLAYGIAATLNVTNIQAPDAGSLFDVVVNNSAGSITSSVAMLTVNLVLADDFNPNANNSVLALALPTDGGVIVGGTSFTTMGGLACTNLGRLKPDGALDVSFIKETSPSPQIQSLNIQTDGKLLVGGKFTKMGAQWRTNLARLNIDGTADPVFNPGANGWVYSTCVQTNGQILVGGSFTMLAGQACTNLGRLNNDGTFDSSFKVAANSVPLGILVQPDGKILVWGYFTTLNNQSRSYIGRLTASGSLDAFNPGADNYVYCTALQPDGGIVVGGSFTHLASQSRNYLGRFDADGNLDANFAPGANSTVNSIGLQTDGKIIVGGSFTTLGGQAAPYVGRLNNNGVIDPLFAPAPNGAVNAVGIQSDGKLVLAGGFTTVAGAARNRLARLANIDAPTQSLNASSQTATWLRGGSSPEAGWTSFDYSTDGSNWFGLGNGTRVSGGWQVSGVNIPTNAILRSRGAIVGGLFNGSGWIVESLMSLDRTIPSISLDGAYFGMVTNSSGNKLFGFEIEATLGQMIVIEASDDMLNWGVLATRQYLGSPIYFSDPQSPGMSRRFYRVRLQ